MPACIISSVLHHYYFIGAFNWLYCHIPQCTDEGKYSSGNATADDYYVDHLEICKKPLKFLIVTDRLVYNNIIILS